MTPEHKRRTGAGLMPYVEVGESRLYYEDHGTGQAIALLHGWAATTPAGSNQVSDAGDGYRVIVIDRVVSEIQRTQRVWAARPSSAIWQRCSTDWTSQGRPHRPVYGRRTAVGFTAPSRSRAGVVLL